MTCVVDTHALVWFLTRDLRLSRTAREALIDPSHDLVVPAIAVAEIAFLYAKRRIPLDVPSVLARMDTISNCCVCPLDVAVLERLPTSLHIHDAIIVGTALFYRDGLGKESAVITRDAQIAASGLVEVVW